MWAGKIKVFHKKAVFLRSLPSAFQKKYFIKCELSKCVYLLYCESACQKRMMREIFIPKQQLNSLPPPYSTIGSIIQSMH